MKEKLEILLREKGLNPSTLARLLEIQPSALSHILSGRNKPSFQLVVKILKTFPDVNPDWLLLDDADMLRSTATSPTASTTPYRAAAASTPEPLFEISEDIDFSESKTEEKNEKEQIFRSLAGGRKRVERVIVLYSDHSFESYTEM